MAALWPTRSPSSSMAHAYEYLEPTAKWFQTSGSWLTRGRFRDLMTHCTFRQIAARWPSCDTASEQRPQRPVQDDHEYCSADRYDYRAPQGRSAHDQPGPAEHQGDYPQGHEDEQTRLADIVERERIGHCGLK